MSGMSSVQNESFCRLWTDQMVYILCEASLFSQHRPPWIVAYTLTYSSCRVRTGLVSGMPFKTNVVHSWSLQICRPQRKGFERIVIHHTVCKMKILNGRTLLRSCCPSGLEVTWPKAVAGLKRIPVIPANILPQHKACVGDLPSPSSRADRRKHDTD